MSAPVQSRRARLIDRTNQAMAQRSAAEQRKHAKATTAATAAPSLSLSSSSSSSSSAAAPVKPHVAESKKLGPGAAAGPAPRPAPRTRAAPAAAAAPQRVVAAQPHPSAATSAAESSAPAWWRMRALQGIRGSYGRLRLKKALRPLIAALEADHAALLPATASAAGPAAAPAGEPRALRASLMPHQQSALAWMRAREAAVEAYASALRAHEARADADRASARAQGRPVDHGRRRFAPPPLAGGILADDMGLGKTVMALALLVDAPAARSLVLMPASLLMQWEEEIARHVRAEAVRVLVYHGRGRRERLRDAVAAAAAAAAPTAAAGTGGATATHPALLVLATYETAAKDVGDAAAASDDADATAGAKGMAAAGSASAPARLGLADVRWTRVLCDEGHVLRNHKTATHRRLCRLRSQARWILTGTPVHNSADDLYGLVHFLNWYPFTQRETWRRVFGGAAGDQQEARLQLLSSALMLRRTKHERDDDGHRLVPLPRRHCHSVAVTLDAEERAAYDAALERAKEACMQLKAAVRGRRAQASAAFLTALLKLRLLCNHRALASASGPPAEQASGGAENDAGATGASTVAGDGAAAGSKAAAATTSDALDSLTDALDGLQLQKATPRSTKISAVISIVKQVLRTPSDKVLIISQWTGTLDLVRQHAREHRVPHKGVFTCCLPPAPVACTIPPRTRLPLTSRSNSRSTSLTPASPSSPRLPRPSRRCTCPSPASTAAPRWLRDTRPSSSWRTTPARG